MKRRLVPREPFAATTNRNAKINISPVHSFSGVFARLQECECSSCVLQWAWQYWKNIHQHLLPCTYRLRLDCKFRKLYCLKPKPNGYTWCFYISVVAFLLVSTIIHGRIRQKPNTWTMRLKHTPRKAEQYGRKYLIYVLTIFAVVIWFASSFLKIKAGVNIHDMMYLEFEIALTLESTVNYWLL